jgi:NADPH:quinone reductase-like Zn-dependent oxidoreductase
MKAIQYAGYGGTEVLQLVDINRPEPKEGEVLIKVEAISLNPVDSKIRNGYLKDILPLTFPFVPGWEAAGFIEESRSELFKAGDEVVTRVPFPRGGAYAAYMVAGQGEVVIKPKELSFIEAATLPVVGGAAYMLLNKFASAKAGDRIFLMGAGGSVGLLAAQMAKALGATVIGSAKGGDLETLRSIGIDEVLDYTVPNYLDSVQQVDLALDFAGGPAQAALMAKVRRGGTLISIVNPPSEEAAAASGIHASFVATPFAGAVIAKVLDMAVHGEIKTRIGKVLPLAQAAEAQQLMDARSIEGKIVLRSL